MRVTSWLHMHSVPGKVSNSMHRGMCLMQVPRSAYGAGTAAWQAVSPADGAVELVVVKAEAVHERHCVRPQLQQQLQA